MTRRSRWQPGLFVHGAVLAMASDAGANGRFPSAQHVVVGPAGGSDVVALRSTFGLVVSRDGGRRFQWVCEDALFYPDALASARVLDPPIEVDAVGRVVFGHPAGVRTLTTGCDIAQRDGTDDRNVVDLAASPDGTVVFAAQYDARREESVTLRATAPALGFVPTGPALARTEVYTLEVAPSDPLRLYLSGVAVGTRSPLVLRSRDGGATWQAAAEGVALGDEAFVSGVSGVDADTVYVRINEGFGSALLRSRDGAATFRVVARSADPMTGFALAADGRTVWFGSINGALHRSDDGGDSFVQVNRLPVLALRAQGDSLWMCSDWQRDFALGRSRDRGATFEPVLRFEDLEGPTACTAPNPGVAACATAWPRQRAALAPPRLDASVRVDATADASLRDAPADAAARDAGDGLDPARPDAALVSPTRGAGCGCVVAGAPRERRGWVLAAAAAAWWLGRRRGALQRDCR